MIYLASPYSHPDPAVREQRFEAVCKTAARMMREGQFVFSPIAHTHPIAKYDLPLGWEFWKRYDREWLAACDEMVVLMLAGWRESRGVEAEVVMARGMGMVVRFMEAL